MVNTVCRTNSTYFYDCLTMSYFFLAVLIKAKIKCDACVCYCKYKFLSQILEALVICCLQFSVQRGGMGSDSHSKLIY